MKLSAIDHPKTLDLMARLDVALPTVLGHLELLWAFVSKHAPQGNVGKHTDGAIARACHWNAEPTAFVTALASAGFLDRSVEHRFTVHDWADHAPRWVLSKLARAQLSICTRDCSAECSPDSSGDSVCHAMPIPSHAMPIRTSPEPDVPRETEWLLEFKLAYPERAGPHNWRAAIRAANARIGEGHSPQEFIEGAKRYAAYAQATASIGTQYVKTAAAFLGPEKHFLDPWPIPRTKTEQRPTVRLKSADELEEEARRAICGP